MQVTQTNAEGLQREFKVVVPADDLEKRVTSKLSELGKQVRLPGFRPGKVPMSLLRKRFGRSVMGEVVEGAVTETSRATIEEQGLRPAIQPKIEVTAFEEGGDLEYKMAVEVLPDFEVEDPAGLALDRPVAEVTGEMVDEALERIAADRKTYAEPESPRPAAEGDRVVLSFAGRLDGDDAPRDDMSAEDMPLDLGSGRFIPGFEDQLVGAGAGEARTVTVTFPDDYQSAEHAGRTAVFDVTVKQVQEASPMPVGDDLAKELGLDDLDALRDAVRQQTEREFAQASRARAKRTLLDTLAERYTFEVPAGMVDQEFEQIWRQVDQALQHHRETKDDPEHRQHHPHDPELDKPEDELRADYRAIAERRVRLGLVLSEIGRRNEIQVTQDELNNAVIGEARRYPGQERQVIEYFQKNPQAIESLRAPLYEDKVVDFILERATVTDHTVTPEELMRDPDEAADGPPGETGETAAEAGQSDAGQASGDDTGGGEDAPEATAPQAKRAKGKAAGSDAAVQDGDADKA